MYIVMLYGFMGVALRRSPRGGGGATDIRIPHYDGTRATRSRLRLRGLVAPRGGMVRLWVWDLRPGVRPLGGVAYRYRLRRRTLIIVRDADGCGRNACEVRPYEQCVRG